MAVYNGELYVGGSFASTASISASRIVKWNGSTWTPVGTGMNNDVLALTVFNGELYAGGRFTTAGGVTANGIAKWNGTSWAAVGTGVGMNDRVRALVVDNVNSILYASGDFTTADGVQANSIAKWNGTSWSGIGVTSPGSVEALAMYNGKLYAGITMVFNTGYVAAYDGSVWSAAGLGNGVDGNIHTLYTYNNELYFGGYFRTAGTNTDSVKYVTKFNGSGFTKLSTGMGIVGVPTSGSGNGVKTLTSFNNDIYAGGEFTSASGHRAKYIAKWNGTTWDSVGTGMDNIVRTLCTYNGELYAGGNFTSAGGTTTYYIAKLGTTTTGIEKNIKTNNINVYPNPTTGIFKFESDLAISDIKIFNSLGELVYQKKTNSQETSIDLSGVLSGVYFYQVTSENNHTKTGKIILQ